MLIRKTSRIFFVLFVLSLSPLTIVAQQVRATVRVVAVYGTPDAPGEREDFRFKFWYDGVQIPNCLGVENVEFNTWIENLNFAIFTNRTIDLNTNISFQVQSWEEDVGDNCGYNSHEDYSGITSYGTIIETDDFVPANGSAFRLYDLEPGVNAQNFLTYQYTAGITTQQGIFIEFFHYRVRFQITYSIPNLPAPSVSIAADPVEDYVGTGVCTNPMVTISGASSIRPDFNDDVAYQYYYNLNNATTINWIPNPDYCDGPECTGGGGGELPMEATELNKDIDFSQVAAIVPPGGGGPPPACCSEPPTLAQVVTHWIALPAGMIPESGPFENYLRSLPGTTALNAGGNIKFRVVAHVNGSSSSPSPNSSTINFHPPKPVVQYPTTGNLCHGQTLSFSAPEGYASYQWMYKLGADEPDPLVSFTSASATITGAAIGADLNESFQVGVQAGPCTSEFIGPYIYYPPAPVITSIGQETPTCPGSGDGQIIVNHQAIAPNHTYIYSITTAVENCGAAQFTKAHNTNAKKTPAEGQTEITINSSDLLDTSVSFQPGWYTLVTEATNTDTLGIGCFSPDYLVCIPPPTAIEVSIPSAPNSIRPPSCAGASDGSADFSIAHGTGPFRWSIVGVDGTTNLAAGVRSFSIGSLAPGNYTVRVRDMSCQEDFAAELPFTIPSGIPLTATFSNTPKLDPTCLNNGTIYAHANVLPGNKTYTFTLFPQGTAIPVENVTYDVSGRNVTINNVPAGTFLVRAEATNCTSDHTDGSVTLFAPQPLSVSHDPDDATCSNSSDGQIQLTSITRQAPGLIRYSYELRKEGDVVLNSPGSYLTESPSRLVSNALAAGTYQLVVTDHCIANASQTINNIVIANPQPISIDDQADIPLVCYEDEQDVNITVNGGTTANYTLNITTLNGTPLPGYPHTSETNRNPTFDDLTVGDYVGIATENCTVASVTDVSDTIRFSLTSPATATIGTSTIRPRKDNNNDGLFNELDHHLTCNQSNDGRLEVTVTGGEASSGAVPYLFELLNNAGVLTTAYENLTNNANLYTVEGLAAGTYSVRITDENNCVRIFDAGTLTAPAQLNLQLPNISSSFADLEIYNGNLYAQCKGDDDGIFSTIATGGNAPYSIHLFKKNVISDEWPDNSFSSVTPTIGAGVFQALGVGFYELRVNDQKNCPYTMREFVIHESPDTLDITNVLPAIFDHGANTICFDDNSGSTRVDVVGGMGEYTYRLLADNTPLSQFNTTDATHTFSMLEALRADGDTIQYTVTLEDQIGCTRKAEQTVQATFELNPPTPVAFSWSIVTKTFPDFEIPCHGDPATIRFISSGGMYPHYITVGGVTKSINGPTGHVDFDLTAGNYVAEFEDALQCQASTQNILLRQPGSHIAIAIGEIVAPVCIGGDDNGTVVLSAINGTQNAEGVEYAFAVKDFLEQSYDGDTLRGESVIFHRPANDFEPKDYMAIAIDGFGCTSELPFTMTVNQNPLTLVNTSSIPPSCFGATDGEITVEASNYDPLSGNTLLFRLWGGHRGEVVLEEVVSGPVHTFTNLLSTDGLMPYRAWVEDANACTDTASQYLNALILESYPPLNLELVSSIRPSCYNGSDGSLLIQASGGVPPYQYSRDGINFQDMPGNMIAVNTLLAGDYTFHLRDANFVEDQPTCLFTTSFTVQPGRFIRLSAVSENVTCFGGDNGAINLSIDIDNRNTGELLQHDRLAIFWTNDNVSSLPISAAEDLTALSSGSYTAHVAYDVDSLVCMQTKSIIVGQPSEAFTIADVKTFKTSCGTQADGRAIISVSGGWSHLVSSYQLDNGPWIEFRTTSVVIKNLSGGTHQLTVSQGDQCTDMTTFEIGSAEITVALDQMIQPSCPQQADGIIVLAADDQTEYSIDGLIFQDFPAFTNLTAGIYQVISRSKNDITCISDPIVISLTDPADCVENPLQLTVLYTLPASCPQASDGSAAVAATGGISPYTFYWDDDEVSGQATSDNLAPGEYRVRVVDAVQVSRDVVVTISSHATVASEIVTALSSCSDACDGSAIVMFSGGSGVYDVSWNAINEAPQQLQQVSSLLDLENLCPQMYRIAVVDSGSNDCHVTTEFTIDHYEDLQVNLLASSSPSCPGASDGRMEIIISGGSGAYITGWDNGTTGSEVEAVSAGEYMVAVEDQLLSCSVSESFTLDDPASIDVASTVITPPSCNGGNNGSIQLTLANVTNPLVSWANGKVGASVNGLKAGEYGYTVTGNNGCSISGTISVVDREALNVGEQISNPLCHNACDGTVSLDIQGGSGPYAISWAHGPKVPSLVNLCGGIYSYVVRDRFNCTVTNSITLVAPQPVEVAAVLQNASCFSASDGAISVVVEGGTGPYEYLWSIGSSSPSINSLFAGVYNLTVMDAQHCQSMYSFTVRQPSLLLITNQSVTPPACHTSADGRINVTASGGTTPYHYRWSDNVLAQSRDQLAGGAYSVTVSDAKGCTFSRTYSITPPSLLTVANVKKSDPWCTDDANGTIEVTPAGGTSPYRYQWSTGSRENRILGLAAGHYNVKITDHHNCTVERSTTLVNPLRPVIEGIQEHTLICRGSVAHFQIDGEWSKYAWKDPIGKHVMTATYSSGENGAHSVTAWDDRNCPASAEFILEVSDNPLRPDFLRLSEAVIYEPVVFVDISVPVPSKIEWRLPEGNDIVVNRKTGSMIELVFTNPGTFEIGMDGFLGNCKAEARKIVEVAGARTSDNGRKGETNEAPVDVALYPNPVKGILSVQVSTTTRDRIELQMLSALDNRRIFSEVVEGTFEYLITWDATPVTNGVYYLIFEQAGKRYSKRIVVMN